MERKSKNIYSGWESCFLSMVVIINNTCYLLSTFLGFPDSSAGKESTCNAGDSGSTSGLGRSAGEGIGYPLQYSWASLVTQLVKNLPAMQETWVRSLGWEDLLGWERLPTPVFLP